MIALPLAESVTVSPPKVKLLPWLSNACTVTVDVVTPSAATEAGDAVIIVMISSAAPTVNVSASVSTMATLLMVPLIEMASATALLIVAVYVPSP